MITHHASPTTLLSYAAGTLPEALGIVVATHLTRCASCRRTVATMEAVGGALLEALPPAPVASGGQDPDLVERLLARANDPEPAAPPILHAALPAPLDRVPMGRWWPIAPGIRWRSMRVRGKAWGGLIRVLPGRALPRHGHVGMELTCVLSGAFADGGEDYVAGDLAEPAADHDDPPIATGTEPCLCVIATEGMWLRGALGRAQRMIGL